MTISTFTKTIVAGAVLAVGARFAGAEEFNVFNPHPEKNRTADGKWTLHDESRPQPPRAAPDEQMERKLAQMPADATVLLGKTGDLAAWHDTRIWHTEDGVVVSRYRAPRDLMSKEPFGSCRLHLEWAAPAQSDRKGQDRANSGVIFMGRYEIQVLDTYENKTYADGMAGAVYGVRPPDFNSLRPSGEWQSYDIWFKRPTFDADGKMATPAYVTVFVNGVLVQNNIPFEGRSSHRNRDGYQRHNDKEPLVLQYHNEIVSYRNVWLVPIDDGAPVETPAGKLGGQ